MQRQFEHRALRGRKRGFVAQKPRWAGTFSGSSPLVVYYEPNNDFALVQVAQRFIVIQPKCTA